MKAINWHLVIKSNALLLLYYTLRVQCYTAGRDASYATTVVLAARCTHLLVRLHKSLYHSDYMANWIVYRKLNRTLELLHLTPGAEPVARSGLQLLHSCSSQFSEEVWKQRKSSGMLFLHRQQPLAHQFKTFLFMHWVQ